VKGTQREGSLAGDPGGYVERLWRWASLSIGVPLRNLAWSSSTGEFEIWMKEAVGMEHFSLMRLSAEGLWEGLLYWRLWKIC